MCVLCSGYLSKTLMKYYILLRLLFESVEGVDPNLQMESEGRRSSLHMAAAEGHREICHILVQVLQDMIRLLTSP